MQVNTCLKYFIGALLFGMIFAGCTPSSSENSSSSSGLKPRVEPLDVTINMTEYKFTPADIEATVGQEVTLTLVNEGELVHELMIGKNVEMHDGIPVGYEVDMFRTGDIIPIVQGDGMLMAHSENGPQDDGGMDMANNDQESMDMSGDDQEGMNMSGDDQEGMDMASDDHEEGMAMKEGTTMDLEGDGALMVMVPVGTETTTLTFTVTEGMVGEWEMGCFQLDGVHYNAGMIGTFTVKEG